MVPKHIEKPNDLVTSSDATRGGFLHQALRKTQEAEPYIRQVRAFLKRLAQADDITVLVDDLSIRGELITAAGFSDKATKYFTSAQLCEAIVEVLKAIAESDCDRWRDEIAYRYLLTKGDALGGTMRNVVGAMAQEQFTESVLDALRKSRTEHNVMRSSSKKKKVQEIRWRGRALLFDKTPRLVRKNIDVTLVECPSPWSDTKALLAGQTGFLCFGEIKGGIDPAGADEHWKTGNSALGRIRSCFGENTPPLFFAAAAIESAMAVEIHALLESGELTHAANLNVAEQVSDLTSWLVSL